MDREVPDGLVLQVQRMRRDLDTGPNAGGRGVEASQVTVVLARTRMPSASPPEWLGRPIVLQNFSPVTPWTYSNVVWFPQPFFRASGMPNVRWEDEVPHGTPPVSGRSAVAQWSHDVPARQTLVTRFVPRD
jgi:hypothetical protein